MIKKPVVGISGCLAGSSVRFDGGHKRASFLMDKLLEWVTFKPVCPEMAIGLPVPRPALRLVRSAQGNIRMCFSHDQNEDVTEKMTEFSRSYLDKLKDVSGFVVVQNLLAVVWNACVYMMKMVIVVVKMEWDYLRAR